MKALQNTLQYFVNVVLVIVKSYGSAFVYFYPFIKAQSQVILLIFFINSVTQVCNMPTHENPTLHSVSQEWNKDFKLVT